MTHFVKMHGCANDYVYFDLFKTTIENPSELSKTLSDRHFGIGGDGIILICPSDKADAKMRIFNADGSEGKMCGNGVRCVAKYLYDYGYAKKPIIKIDTLSGIKTVELKLDEDNNVVSCTVDMGKAEFAPYLIPVILQSKDDRIINFPYTVDGQELMLNCVSMGNPHCVLFVKGVNNMSIERLGRIMENNAIFPEGVNTEFVEIVNHNTIRMRVWERGSGETLACGTGACASVVAAVENGYFRKGETINVILKGGELKITYTDDGVTLEGPATKVFEGDIQL